MSANNKNTSLMRLIYTAVFAALIFIATFLFKVPIGNGYYHLGDAFIYVAAVCLPLPYAMTAAALGAALADLSGGYVVYIIPTLIIKAILPLFFSRRDKALRVRNIIAVFLAAAVTVAGYYLAEVVLGIFIFDLSAPQSFTEATITIYGNVIQSVVGAAVFLAAAAVIDSTRLRDRFFNTNI